MRISHYFEWEDVITGGHKQSVKNQRKIMEENGIEYTTKPDLSADILHLNNMGPRSIYYAKKAQRKDVPVLIHAHQTSEDLRESFAFSNLLSRPLKPYLKYAYSLGDHLICPSEHNKKVIEEYTGTKKTVVSNGFDPEKIRGFEKHREEYLERYNIDPPVVFNVGHVIKRKGLESFIKTAREMPELDFAWFGYLNPTGGNFDSILKSRDTQRLVNNSPDNCTFTGYIEDIRGAYAAGDIFFFPTKNENEGMALLEAMAASKPVVVRDIDTFEWLEDGENCLKTEENFAAELEKLKDSKIREKLGRKAKKKSEQFELDKVSQELISVYESLI